MKIETADLREIARTFLNVLDKERILSNDDLEKRLGERFPLDGSEDFIMLEMRPSNYGTTAQTISYIRDGTGIPIKDKQVS